MNLHQIVSGAIGTVNPHVSGTVQISTGYTTAGDGTQVPAYAPAVTRTMQVQPLSSRDIQHLASLNIQGSNTSIYIDGELNGIVREDRKGGDLITIAGKVYLVTTVLENWPDWTKVAAILQVSS